jgi:transcriptional regulator with XRE-family HTH domain
MSAADNRATRMSSGPDVVPGDPGMAPPLRIGPQLRAARARRKLSLDQVAAATGLTKGFLSQLERDMTTASVASLVKLCSALHIGIGSLFEPSQTMLTRNEGAPPINFGGTGVSEQLLTPRESSDMQVIRSRVSPGGGSGDEPYALDAKAEVVYVLEGELVVTVDAEIYTMRTGDTLTFSPRQLHSWSNPSATTDAVVLWALAPSPW